MATAKCSCSLSTDYHYHTRVFKNYDPISHRHGVLRFEEGSASYTSPEGMWYSTVTDMDFCMVHGKSHDHRGVYLIPYNGVVDGVVVSDGYFTNERINSVVADNATCELSRKDLFLDKLSNWNLFSI